MGIEKKVITRNTNDIEDIVVGDRLLILALRSHLRLQLKVQSGFWLVLPEQTPQRTKYRSVLL